MNPKTAPNPDRHAELVEEEYQKIVEAENARRLAKAHDAAGYRLRLEEATARPLAEHAARLGPDFTLVGLVWPDYPGRHRLGPDPVFVKAPWSLQADGVYRQFHRLVQPTPLLRPGINVGVRGLPDHRQDPYDYKLCSPCFPMRRPGSGKGWTWAVKGHGWKTIEIPLLDERGNPTDLVAALADAGVKFNPEPATWTVVGAMTGERDKQSRTARQLFDEFVADHERQVV